MSTQTFKFVHILSLLLILCFGCTQTPEPIEPPAAPEYYQYFHELTKDPATGEIPTERLLKAKEVADQKFTQMAAMRSIPMTWVEQGPSGVGGRTRAILIDQADPSGNTVLAGSVSGGLWRTTNFRDSNPNWVAIDEFLPSLAISSLTQHPLDFNIMYASTGEANTSDFYGPRGVGIFKSIDGGLSWEQLPNTQQYTFRRIPKLVVTDNGTLIFSNISDGIYRSTDDGVSSQKVLGEDNINGRDIEIASDGTLFASLDSDGIYQSTDDGLNWTKISTSIPSIGPLTGRIELASFAGDPDILLALVASNSHALYRTIDRGNNWEKVPMNLGMGTQYYWNLNIGIHPTDPDKIAMGMVSGAFTQDGGENWTYMGSIHVDHHVALFDPNDPDFYIDGNDGGIFSADASQNQLFFDNKNSNYNVTQFYRGAIHPEAGRDEYIGGTQDNGTWRVLPGPLGSQEYIAGGDGAFCAYDEDEPHIFIQSFQNGAYRIYNEQSNTVGSLNVKGLFINTSVYDSQNNVLYAFDSGYNNGSFETGYVFIENVGNTTNYTPQKRFHPEGFSFAYALTLSPNVSERLYLGTNAGRLHRVDNCRSSNPIWTDISPLGVPLSAGGIIHGIDIEVGNEDHILLTNVNYGVPSVLESTDGGQTWTNVEGDLPDMPVYKGLFAPDNSDHAIIATDLGVWTTENLDGANTVWMPSNGGLANVRVMDLDIRKSDHTILAASHGRGLFTSDYFKISGQDFADLSLSIQQSASVIDNGDQFTVDLTLTNDGPNDAVNIEVGDFLPAGISLVEAFPPSGSTFDAPESWLIPSLPSGQALTLVLQLKVDLITQPVQKLIQVRAVETPDPDSTPNNNNEMQANEDDEVVLKITPINYFDGPDLELDLAVNNPYPDIYSNVTFILTLVNTGTQPATGIQVDWPPIPTLPFTSQSVSQGSFTQWNGFWDVGTLDTGDEAVIELTLFMLSTEAIPVFAQVSAQNEADADSNPDNNPTGEPTEDDEASVILNPDCTLTDSGLGTIFCTDNGTSDPSDDQFFFTINPSGTNLSSAYDIGGDIQEFDILYGSPWTVGPFPISTGQLNLILSDASGGCSVMLAVNPPDPCSTEDCAFTGAGLAEVLCNDKGTPSADDDTYSFLIHPSGTNLSSVYSIMINGLPGQTNVSYGTPYYPVLDKLISEGAVTIKVTDNSGACSLEFTVDPPASCSGGGEECSTLTNLALNRPATQSSTLNNGNYTGEAIKAVDGNTDGRFYTPNSAEASVSHTNWAYQSYWEVELAEKSRIETIHLYNRTDGSGTTDNFYVLISDTPFGNANLGEARSQASYEKWINGPAGSPTTIDLVATGKYVHIQSTAGGFIALAEVEVLGCKDDEELCTLSASVNNIRCEDNGTGMNPDDDVFYFDLDVASNKPGGWRLRVASFPDQNGSFGTSTLGPYQIADFLGGTFDASVSHLSEQNCGEVISFAIPDPCSDDIINGDGADLELSMFTKANSYKQWEAYVFTITVANMGNEPSNDIQVFVPQPDGTAFTSAFADQGNYLPWGTFEWGVGTLEAGQQATLEVSWFTLVAGPEIRAFAEVKAATGNDLDSTPGNGNGTSAVEDDEAVATLTFNSLSPEGSILSRDSETRMLRSLYIQEVYPNPAIERVKGTIFSKTNQSVRLEIYDSKGQRVETLQHICKQGPNQILLDIHAFRAGVFTMIAFPETGMATSCRFVKVRR